MSWDARRFDTGGVGFAVSHPFAKNANGWGTEHLCTERLCRVGSGQFPVLDKFRALKSFGGDGAGPYGDEAEDEAAAGVERGQDKSAGAHGGERLPFIS